MLLTTVRVERPEGTVVARGVAALIEEAGQAAAEERMEWEGARPVDLVMVSSTQGVPVVPWRRRDVLFDEVNVDPETGATAKYRIIAPVETFDRDHQEALCERVVGG